MNYYKMRMMLATDTSDWLATLSKEAEGEQYKAFVRRMTMKYGATERMVKDILLMYDIEVVGEKLVRRG